MKPIIQGAFRNKAAIILLVVMVLGLGVLSYFKLPMELMPEADNPQVTVVVTGQGYDAATMESQVTDPLEQALAGIKGKKDIFSTSGDNFSQINLDFDSKTNMKDAKAEVEKAVSVIPMPERASPPYVVQLNTSMIPITYIALTFVDGVSEADRESIEREIVDRFRSIDGAGSVQLGGQSQASVNVIPDTAKLTEKGVPLQALYGVLQGRSGSTSVGQTTLNGTIVNLGVASDLSDIETLKKLPVANGVTLGEVAEVTLTNDTETISRIDGKDALSIIISKAANANAVSVGKDAIKIIDDWNKENKQASLQMLMNTSDEIVHSVNSMMREVLMGALFATLVILLFMRNVRATLVTIVSIPLSLALTLYLLDLSGISLNILTLGGVAVAVGRLVDDSIVVTENIFRRLQKESFSVGLIIDATREVSRAITASTLTTVAVFLPMGLLRGSMQDFLLPFALTVTYSLLSSLAVALTVIPLMSSGVLKGSRIKEHKPSERFMKFLHWNLKHKWIPLLIAFVLLVGSIGTYVSLPKGAVDNSSAMSVDVSLEYKPDTPIDQVYENGKKLEEFLIQQDGREWVYMNMGNSADSVQYGDVKSSTLVSYMVKIKDGKYADKIIEAVNGQKDQYPGAELSVGASSFFGGGSSTQVYVDITGNDEEKLAATASDVIAKIKPIKDVLKVESNQDEKTTSYTLEVNPTEAKSADISSQLQGMLNPVPIGAIQSNGQSLNVVLQPVLKLNSAEDLSKLSVATDDGMKPVSEVAQWVKAETPTKYFHKDGKTYIRVTATVEPSQLSTVGANIKKELDKVTTPDGVKLNIGGASADQSDDFASLFMMMIVSIGIVYLIMVFTFKTLRAPLAILASILFVPIGAVLGLIVTGVSPDFTAIFGVVMLIGIVVTNAIVLIDRVKQNEEKMTIREALLEAAGTRMRPILMTAIATVCAMLPLVFGSSESGSIVSQSLAIVVIGGLVVATLLTLILVPCIYELLFFRKSKRQRLAISHSAAA